MKIWLKIVITSFALVGLSACGRRGGLEPALDASAPKVVAPAPATSDPVSGASVFARRPKKVPIAVPQKPFILDPIL